MNANEREQAMGVLSLHIHAKPDDSPVLSVSGRRIEKQIIFAFIRVFGVFF